MTFAINVPDDYTCNYLAKTGCWISLQMDYGENYSLSDTTSWALKENGAPPRLYNASKYTFP
jgi:hypothetical protein